MKRIILWALVAGLVIFAGAASYTFHRVYKGVVRITEQAKSEFSGDAMEALRSMIVSDSFSFEEKNTAIWALGQFADPDALPFLEELNSGIAEQRVPFDRSSDLSKYEIEKAIKWCKKGNLTSWMYRKIRL
jgi:hypothetical protein